MKWNSIVLTYFLVICFSSMYGQVNTRSSLKIETSIGEIVVFQSLVESKKTPILFLHGLFFDHTLWDSQVKSINDRSVFAIDMPMHGKSLNCKPYWNLQDCASMLLEIVDKLEIQEVHAVGHSWGGMTILRAAESHPDRFQSISFFNTPFEAYTQKEIRKAKLQLKGLVFKHLFIKMAAKNIFASQSLQNNAALFTYFKSCMLKLSNRDIKYLNQVVRIDASDKLAIISDLKIKHQIIVGKEDKIATAPHAENVIYIEGGHTSPLEYPEESLKIILSQIE